MGMTDSRNTGRWMITIDPESGRLISWDVMWTPILEAVEEAEPAREMMDIPGMEHELRRPMMLLVRARG